MKQPPSFPIAICLGFGALGLVAYVLMAWIDISYGKATSMTVDGQDILPATMLFVSGFGFFCASGAGYLFRSRRYAWSVALFLVTGAYMAYTALNGVGFFAGETVSKTRAVVEHNKAAKEATELANQRSMKLIEDAMSWLKSTQVRTARERERIEDKVIELATKPVEVKAVNKDAMIADARAEVMSKLTGWQIEAVQLTNSIWVVGLLVVGKLLGPAFMVGFWPQPKVGVSLQGDFPTDTAENARNWMLSPKQLSKQESYLDLRQIFPQRTHPITLPFLAAKWGLTAEGTRQRLKDWEARKLITLDKVKTDRGYALYVKGISPVLVADNSDQANRVA